MGDNNNTNKYWTKIIPGKCNKRDIKRYNKNKEIYYQQYMINRRKNEVYLNILFLDII